MFFLYFSQTNYTDIMKKLLCFAILSIAGSMSANELPCRIDGGKTVRISNFDEKKETVDLQKALTIIQAKQNSVLKSNSKVYNLVKISTKCGQDFYLNSEDYDNIYSFLADVEHFTIIKCGPEQFT